VVNQNYRPDWRDRMGRAVTNHRGLLAVPLVPGHHVIQLQYRPWDFALGLSISIVTWMLLGYWIWSHRSSRRTERASQQPLIPGASAAGPGPSEPAA